MNLLKRIKRMFRREPLPTPIINTVDGRCVMLLPNQLYHATLRAQGKVTTDFQTWAKETYGDVKFI